VRLGLSVPAITVPTRTTRPTRVSWIHHEHHHFCQCCFVVDKGPKLTKCPIAMTTALLVPNRCSLSNPLQVFQSKCLARLRRLPNQALTDHMIGVFLKPSLSAACALQSTLGVLGANGLQALTTQVIAFSHLLRVLAAECFAIIGRRKRDNSQVHTDHSQRFAWLRRRLGLRDTQIPRIPPPHQLGTTRFPRFVMEAVALKRSQLQMADDTTMEGVEGDLLTVHQTIGARIVAQTAVGTKGGAGRIGMLTAGAYGFGRRPWRTTRELCAKAELSTSSTIHNVVQCILVGNALLPCNRCAVRGSSIEGSLCFAQCGISCEVNVQFTADGTCGEWFIHEFVYIMMDTILAREGRFLRRLKSDGLRATFL